MPAPILVLTCGNPSRGDDALGSALHDLIEAHKRETGELFEVEVLTDFQLQIEHAVDLEGRECVIFADASINCAEPFEMYPLAPARDDTFTTHAMSPATVLSVYKEVNGQEPPPAHMLEIRAYEFGLGKEMTAKANANLQRAFKHILTRPW
ncbi:MAG: hydrogenase maturation protease [Lysobacterales bacterium]|jgi:hydrogenase maturation protease